MSLYRPSELQHFLESLGIHPKKGLSQNFLIDGNIIRKIVATAAVVPGDIVLEIGPGPGALTEALLEAGARVVAVEKDRILAEALMRLDTPDHRLEVVNNDILEVDVATLFPGGQRVKVIANLPYHITTPILTRMIPRYELFETVTVMVQKEVAERMTSPPGRSSYSSLTVFLNFYAACSNAFVVSRRCFIPAPKVDSAVVHLKLKPPRAVSDRNKFFQMTRTAFEHRRKMLRASLRELYPSESVTQSLTDLELNPLARPEELSLEELILLFERLQ